MKAHNASQPVSLSVRAGDILTVGRRDDTWTEWFWCIAPDGRASWMPETYLELLPGGAEEPASAGSADAAAGDDPGADAGVGPEGPRTAVARRDYDATELTVRPGETVTVLEEVSGWVLCRRDDDEGWIPAGCLYHRGGQSDEEVFG